MDMASQSKASMNKKIAFVALGISLIAETTSPSLALGLPNLSSQKKTALQYEVYSKMSPGAGPQTNDLQKQEPQLDNNTGATASKPVDLSPVTMDENEKKDLGPAEEGVFKATVKLERAATSGPIEQTEILKPKSIKPSIARGGSVQDQARMVNLMPTGLQQTMEEEQSQADIKYNAEKLELADLWDSTLARSQDIQFVVQKLMPNNNSGKTASVMMKMLSATVFGGMSMMTMMAPNMGAQVGANAGASLMMQALNGMQTNADKKARLNQTEAIMLYKIVRDTAKQLVDAFKDYKIELSNLQRSNEDLNRLQGMVKDVRASQTPVEQIKLESILMEKQSEIQRQSELVSRHRQTLVDLSGTDAVAKLDKQIEVDKQKIADAAVQLGAPETNSTEQQQQAPAEPANQQIAAPNSAVPN